VPERVDEGATDRLFDEASTVVDDEHSADDLQGRHFAGNGVRPTELRAGNEAVVHDLTAGTGPLVRYEWRNQAGETMIVEAAWPFATKSADFGEPSVRREPGFDRAS